VGGRAGGEAARDLSVMTLVGGAHGLSHFLQLTLPPLFPLLREEFGVGYLALGALMSLFYAVSGVGQTASGFIVDRVGARPVLLGGMGLFAAAIALVGLAPSFRGLVPLLVLAGVGNSVFHPADYAILTVSVTPRRLGRAYSIHSVAGALGWALAPVVVVSLSAVVGWRGALVVVGGLALGVTALLAVQGTALAHGPAGRSGAPEAAGAGAVGRSLRLLLNAPILAAFAYFTLLAAGLIGVQTFSVAAMAAIYDAPLVLATGALTGFLLGSAAGVLAGGVLADRTRRHDVVAAIGLGLGALGMALVATGAPAPWLLTALMAAAGCCVGVTSPSRDMLVRAVTPPGGSGKVFGFVYSGLDLGQSATPLVFGWLLDHGQPRAVFFVVALFLLLTMATVVQVRRHAVPVAARI
jgi:MFS transporter, FSR family, fosmidomycin resistance protein